MLKITSRAKREAERLRIEPQLVLEIEGISTRLGALEILRLIRVGEEGLYIDGSWRIGGLKALEDQADLISLEGGGSTRIDQQLRPDQGSVSSISSVQIALQDRDLIASQIVSPGVRLPDILGVKATLYMGFKNTAYKEDYTPVFSGIIDDVESSAGMVKINLAHPEQKKRQELFEPVKTEVLESIGEYDTEIDLTDASELTSPIVGPSGAIDSSFRHYIRVEDEIIEYAGITGNTLTGCTRGMFGTLATAHRTNQTTRVIVSLSALNPPPAVVGTRAHFFFVYSAYNHRRYHFWIQTNVDFVMGGVPYTFLTTDPGLANPATLWYGIPDSTGVQIHATRSYYPPGASDAQKEGVDAANRDQIASGIINALIGHPDFTATRNGDAVLITNRLAGPATESKDIDTGMKIETEFQGVDRLEAASHVGFSGDAMSIALKLMLSGADEDYAPGTEASRFVQIDYGVFTPNAVLFRDVDLERDLGVSAGDFITLTGSGTPANNCEKKRIQRMGQTLEGSYLVVEGVSFELEPECTSLASFHSQYNVWPMGLGLSPDQVDVSEHTYWRNLLLANAHYDFLIEDKISGKEFLDKEVYLPIGAFSIPRQGKCSIGYHAAPIARGELKLISKESIKDPDKIKIRRTLSRNFYNTIIYRYEPEIGGGEFLGGFVSVNEDSKARIQVGTKALTVQSRGLRRDQGAEQIAESTAERYLKRYQFAAEFFESIGLLFKDGYHLEPGDSVLFDPESLAITNFADGTRDKPAKLYAVINKTMDLKTGDVKLALTDTNFDLSERYGVISPCSEIESGTVSSIVIRDSFGSFYPGDESRKWADLLGENVIIRAPDWSAVYPTRLKEISLKNSYEIRLDPAYPLPSAPLSGYFLEVAPYSADAKTGLRSKAVNTFLSSSVAITSVSDRSTFSVALSDQVYFTPNKMIRIRSFDFTRDQSGAIIESVAAGVITLKEPLAFMPIVGDLVEGVSFQDGSPSYKLF